MPSSKPPKPPKPRRPRQKPRVTGNSIGLYDDQEGDGTTKPEFKLLTEPVACIPWDTFSKAVQAVVDLLGGIDAAEYWKQTVLKALQGEWDHDFLVWQNCMMGKVERARQLVDGVQLAERAQERTLFHGMVVSRSIFFRACRRIRAGHVETCDVVEQASGPRTRSSLSSSRRVPHMATFENELRLVALASCEWPSPKSLLCNVD